MLRMFGSAILLVICCCAPSALAVCAINDGSFTTGAGGCKDLNTGLVWSSDALGLPGTNQFPHGSNAAEGNGCGGLAAQPEGGGYTDWRLPTVGEVQEALANGLNSHLDFYYDAGNQPVDSKYRWTRCPAPKIKGSTPKYVVRYSDGSTISGAFNVYDVICVRALASDNDCPGPGKKNRPSGATNSFAQAATGIMLLLPLGLVVAARCFSPRWR